MEKLPNTVCARRVGVAAFFSSLRGLKLVLSKWHCLVPPGCRAYRETPASNVSRQAAALEREVFGCYGPSWLILTSTTTLG